MRIADVMLAFPYLLLALIVVSILGPGLTSAVVAIGIAYLPQFARLVRGAVLEVMGHQYMEAARALGVPAWQQMWRHVLRKDRKSTRLNSSHDQISYAVFCLKKKNTRFNSSHDQKSYTALFLKKNHMKKLSSTQLSVMIIQVACATRNRSRLARRNMRGTRP